MPVILDNRQWKSFFGKLKRDLRNPIPKLSALASTMGYANVIQHFRDEKGPDGKWADRDPKTQRAYARLNKTNRRYNPSNKLLQLNGTLRKDLRIARQEKRAETIGRHGVRLYTGVPWAGRHNYGTKGMKQREFMYLDGSTQQKMADALVKWLAEG